MSAFRFLAAALLLSCSQEVSTALESTKEPKKEPVGTDIGEPVKTISAKSSPIATFFSPVFELYGGEEVLSACNEYSAKVDKTSGMGLKESTIALYDGNCPMENIASHCEFGTSEETTTYGIIQYDIRLEIEDFYWQPQPTPCSNPSFHNNIQWYDDIVSHEDFNETKPFVYIYPRTETYHRRVEGFCYELYAETHPPGGYEAGICPDSLDGRMISDGYLFESQASPIVRLYRYGENIDYRHRAKMLYLEPLTKYDLYESLLCPFGVDGELLGYALTPYGKPLETDRLCVNHDWQIMD